MASGGSDQISRVVKESIRVKEATLESQHEIIKKIVVVAIEVLRHGEKIMLCGNGGSAAQAQHLAAEIIGRYKKNRRAYAALALSTDTSVLTSVANDFSYEEVFSKQVEGLARKGDLLWVLSTSGNSLNVIRAVEKAKTIGCITVGFTGEGGGALSNLVDYCFKVSSHEVDRIQETHITIGHAICEQIEEALG